MGFNDIMTVLLVASILFELYVYKSSMRHLKSYKGLSKMTKMVNDINFNKDEQNLFILHIKRSITSSHNALIFALLFTATAIYFSNDSFYIAALCMTLLVVSYVKHTVIKKYANELLDVYKIDTGAIQKWMVMQ